MDSKNAICGRSILLVADGSRLMLKSTFYLEKEKEFAHSLQKTELIFIIHIIVIRFYEECLVIILSITTHDL